MTPLKHGTHIVPLHTKKRDTRNCEWRPAADRSTRSELTSLAP